MNVLFDTNVVLDVLLRRETWLADAERLWKAAEEGRVRAFVCASSITDIFYTCRKLIGAGAARGIVRGCLDRLEIVGVTRDLLDAAYALGHPDFEDDLQAACAVAAGLDAIVTRNAQDFAGSPVAVLSPAELLGRLATDDPA